jgi:hypothetical protein
MASKTLTVDLKIDGQVYSTLAITRDKPGTGFDLTYKRGKRIKQWHLKITSIDPDYIASMALLSRIGNDRMPEEDR